MKRSRPQQPTRTGSARKPLGTRDATLPGRSPQRGPPHVEKAHLAVIGTGTRGQQLLRHLVSMRDLSVTAVCDVYRRHREEGHRMAGRQAAALTGYEDVLARRDLDAVVVATSSHWHAPIALAALEAGKAVYVETPAFHTVQQGREIRNLVRKKELVYQVGAQRRSSAGYRLLRKTIARGQIGKVTLARGWWHCNSRCPMWRHPIYEDLAPATLDWTRFDCPDSNRCFDPVRFRDFQLYWDYSFGAPSELLWHQIDIILACLGPLTPVRASAVGGVFRWIDGRETPDTFAGVCEFKEGVNLEVSSNFASARHSNGEEFLGTQGTIASANGSWELVPEAVSLKTREPRKVKGKVDEADHLRHFVDALKGRGSSACDAEDAFSVGSVVLMLCEAFRGQSLTLWDEETESVVPAASRREAQESGESRRRRRGAGSEKSSTATSAPAASNSSTV